ncbi:MAG TPA: PAS domain S-box protein [Methanocella sp.]|nr:PAS domain S-box protein [Methanocella sp.]
METEYRAEERRDTGREIDQVLDTIDDAVLLVDRSFVVTNANREAARLFGMRREDLAGKHLFNFYPEASNSKFSLLYEQAIIGGEPVRYEVPSRALGGWYEVSVHPSEAGGTIVFRNMMTWRPRDEAQMMALLAITHADQVVLMVKPNGHIYFSNSEARRVLGYAREELTRLGLPDLVPEPCRGNLQAWWDKAKAKGSVVFESELCARDGRTAPYEVSISSFNYYFARYYFVSARDVSGRERTEEALKEARDTAELYLDLMGHDINNMNQIVMGYLELLQQGLGADHRLAGLIPPAIEALDRSARIIGNVRKLQRMRAGSISLGPIDVADVLRQAIAGFAPPPGRDVRINYAANGPLAVPANELLGDVFANIIGNAIKHSSGPVTIDVRADRVLEGGRELCAVTIEDDGPGIPDPVKARLFSRFQRGDTKASGTGLGLFLARALVEGFRGRIRVEDRVPGDHTRGTRFVVTLPMS